MLELKLLTPKDQTTIGTFFMGPRIAKLFMITFQELIESYEKENGELKVDEKPTTTKLDEKKDSAWKGIA
jgi:hypothetical protein